MGGQLAQGGGLAHAIDSDQQHDLGATGFERPWGSLVQEPQQFLFEDALRVDVSSALEFPAEPGHELVHSLHTQIRLEEQVLQFFKLSLVETVHPQQPAHGRQHQLLGAPQTLPEFVEQATKQTHGHLAKVQST